MTRANEHKEDACPATRLFTVLSRQHMLSILYRLSLGTMGFNELGQRVVCNTATLTKRLRELEQEGLVVKVVCEQDKRNRYYSLSKKGKRVSGAIEKLGDVARVT